MINKKDLDLILEHYIQIAEDETLREGYIVRIYKPRTMGPIESLYRFRDTLKSYIHNAIGVPGKWFTGNPDWGYWDAQVVYKRNVSSNIIDIYFCAIICHPWTEEDDRYYEEHMSLPWYQRLLLMWDNRIKFNIGL